MSSLRSFNSKGVMPKALREFHHVKRFLDPMRDHTPTAKLLPGEYYVTKNDEILSTVLGSCIACCVYDLEGGIGGMNHFMLPHLNTNGAAPNWDMNHPDAETRFGNFAMEKLINAIMKYGGSRSRLQFKIFGGGNILNSRTQDVGARNAEFAEHFIDSEGFKLTTADTGTKYPRKVNFYPLTGRVQVKKLDRLASNTLIKREDSYDKEAKAEFDHNAKDTGNVDLF